MSLRVVGTIAASNAMLLPSVSPNPPGSMKSRCMSITIRAVFAGVKVYAYGLASTVSNALRSGLCISARRGWHGAVYFMMRGLGRFRYGRILRACRQQQSKAEVAQRDERRFGEANRL